MLSPVVAKSPGAKRQSPVSFSVRGDGTLVAVWTPQRYRFLLSDGRTVDVLADRDDSDLRGALLSHTKAEAIAGVVRITLEGMNGSEEPG